MALSMSSHSYIPIPPSDNIANWNDKETESSSTISPTTSSRQHNTCCVVKTTTLVLLAFLAGALLPGIIMSTTKIKELSEANKLQELLSFPSELKTFVPDENFTSPPTVGRTTKAWIDLLGPSRGFIALENSEKTYGLRPGRELSGDTNKTRQVYGVSMFHQLHCLIMIRNLYYNALQSDTHASSDNQSTGSILEDLAFATEHTEHCFDYLQQSIRCAGLMQIEVPHGSRNNVFDGYGTEHTCTSWTSVVEFMEKYKVRR